MNAASSHSKWLALGLGVLGIAACSAEASEPAVKPGTGTAGASTGAGGSGNGTAGSLPIAGTTPTGTAGTAPAGTAGTAPAGTAGTAPAGTAGTAPAGTAGSGAGGTDGGALTVCPSPPAAGTITDLLIDDMEDGDNGLKKIGGRSGFWYTYSDEIGTMITPTPDKTKTMPLKPGTTNCHGASTSCVIITGTTVANDETAMPAKYAYAGVGFDFSNAMKPCVYNGGAYSGIKFWARGDVAVTIKLNTPATVPVADGGTCAATDVCTDGFSPAGVDVLLDTEWTQVDIPFATAKQAGWGTAVTLDKTMLWSLQVQIPPGQTFNVALDDFTFY